jgi:chemotaxis protein methyltransferase CheR
MDADLRRLAALVQQRSGVVIRDAQLDALRAALARLDPGLTPAHLLTTFDPKLLDRLVDEVTIKETFFLRHVDELETIDWAGMAARAAAAERGIRVWSVGCSTGEEVYSLGLLATEALGTDPPIEILGTDLSLSALASAEQGLYRARSMRLVDRERRRRWFVQDGEGLRVGRDLRRLARFARHNVILDGYPPDREGPFDLIVCRNILIYFESTAVLRIVNSLPQALAPGGRLLLGTVDRLGSAPAAVASPPPQPATHDEPPRRMTPTRRLHAGTASRESSAEAAHAAFEVGSLALHAGDADAAVRALRRALYLDPRRAVVALQLGRAHEALDQTEAARRAYWRALRLVDETPDQEGTLLYDRIAAGDVVAACHARLAVLPYLIES